MHSCLAELTLQMFIPILMRFKITFTMGWETSKGYFWKTRKDRLKQISNEKTVLYRKTSSDSQKSAASRSKSFNGSRESLNLFGSVDFKNFGISKNFSSEIIQEVYGSKTSLLKHLDQQREERKLKQSELNLGDHVKTRETSVTDLLSKSTDSILLPSSRRSSADNSGCLCNQTGNSNKEL